MLGGEPFTKWEWLCSRDLNECVIIAEACLKWQGKDCLQATASKKHFSLSKEDILIEHVRYAIFSCCFCSWWSLLLSDALLCSLLSNRIAAHLSHLSVTSVERMKRLSSVLKNLSLWVFLLHFVEFSLALY